MSAVRSTGPRRKGSNSSSTRSGAISGPPELTYSSADASPHAGADLHPACRDVVPHRVLHEVPGDAARAAPGRPPSARARVLAHPQPAPRGLGPHRGQRGHDEVGEVDGPGGGGIDGRRRLAAGQQEQPRDQVVGPPAGLADHVAHPPQLVDVGVGIGEGHVDLGPQHRQRGPQLMAGVGDEPALRIERRLQPVEHRVEAGRQFRDLAAGVAAAPGGCRATRPTAAAPWP